MLAVGKLLESIRSRGVSMKSVGLSTLGAMALMLLLYGARAADLSAQPPAPARPQEWKSALQRRPSPRLP